MFKFAVTEFKFLHSNPGGRVHGVKNFGRGEGLGFEDL